MNNQFLETNYLSPDSLDKLLLAIPQIPYFESDYNKLTMIVRDFQILYQVCYYCALRITEGLRLEVEDFDLEHRVLKLKPRPGAAKTFKKMGDKIQKTSINPVIIEELKDYLKDKTGPLFKCSRVTAWKYAKLAGELAGLKVFEEQKVRTIEGVWTHLFRKSYAKLMESKGATPSLIMLKGRWSPREMYQTYTKPSLNALIEWEARNFGN